jgi:hypothetical protein
MFGSGFTGFIFLNVDGHAYDVGLQTELNFTNNGIDEIWGTAGINNTIDLQIHYKLVNNPSTNINPDTLEYEFIATNITSSNHSLSLMVMIDTDVDGVDGANLSTDDGLTTATNSEIFYKSIVMPPDWWDYDVDPKIGTPNLVGRGHLFNNPYCDPATEPDIFVLGNWSVMSDLLLYSGDPWSLIAAGDSITVPRDDSAVELWWTDGKGGGLNSRYSLPAGQSLTWITYYGLNQGVLLATPTISATYTPTPTITQTFTITPTYTITPTFTQTPVPLKLTGGFPNIFHNDVNIIYWLSRNATVTLKVFTVSGEVVLSKSNIQGSKGYNKFYWDGQNNSGRPVATGIYIYEIDAVTDINEHARVMAKLACVK